VVSSTVTLSVNSATAPSTNLTTNKWGHICFDSSGEPAFVSTTGNTNEYDGLPSFSATAPVLCLADVKADSSTNGKIGQIYDTRTFTSTLKEAVTLSTRASLGWLVDSGSGGALVPASAGSAKLYGVVVATDGSTSTTTPNAIVSTNGAAWVKADATTNAGQFVITDGGGYSVGHTGIPNNSFYYSAGNARTSYATGCTSAATCTGSVYVNFNVR
jgi:hypothetical protein